MCNGYLWHLRIVWENITNCFLLFNIPVDIPLSEIDQEVSDSNNLKILELCWIIKKDSTKNHSPVLVMSLGISLPSEIKLFFLILQICQFIDYTSDKFNHTTFNCKPNQICATYGIQNEGLYSNLVSCSNCGGDHRSDYNQCSSALRRQIS